MKSNITIKNIFAAFLVIGALGLISCNNETDSKKIAEKSNEALSDEKESDADFLVSAAEINLEEIKLGELAQINGMNADVKELGKMMQTEHNNALKDLEALAAKKNIIIPTMLTEDGQKAYKKLIDKTGLDFDKDYCDMMVKGHEKAIHKFEKASTEASDPDIQMWASSMLPALRMHLDHSVACKNKCDNM